MAIVVRLKILTGPHKGHKFCFCGPTRCQVGRGSDCYIHFSGNERDHFISRHHCRLEIDPPLVLVEDLGSRNGTYVNGHKIEAGTGKSGAKDRRPSPDLVVHPGDLITVGGMTMQVDIVDCPLANGEVKGDVIWQPGETAKRDCPVKC